MRSILLTAVMVACAAGTFAGEPVTAERLGAFYPPAWESKAFKPPAYSHLVLPGFQKASTTRYYDFGSVEITYYDKGDAVFEKKLERLKSRKDMTTREISGCRVALLDGTAPGRGAKALADVGGEIVIDLDCGTCKGVDEILARIQAFDLEAMAALLR